ncbi:GGDEF domain-containing protein [Desulfosarcina cetonica]|uniref:GGDEF domain-containing protein n=1 Tax=Desulfosarcina cetonica TaxID=90730 RepID=UPI0006D20ED8|nr:diguanylate cyclase [Desulfosarcina cetonica]
MKKIQTIRHDQPKTYAGGKTILNLDQKVSILCLENDDGDFVKLEQILDGHNQIRLTRVTSIQTALEQLAQGTFDLAFSEYRVMDGTGLALLEAINREGIETPVVIITSQGDEVIASRLIQIGAYDYLPKSKLNGKALLRIISNALEKAGLKREMRIAQEKLAEMSVRDELTGMFNRRYFQEALDREVFGAQRYGHGLAMCMFDLDHFKRVNDTHGHLCGDRILQEFSHLLEASIRKYDVACRYGGEEFAVILPDTSLEKAVSLCERFRERVMQHIFTYEKHSIHITTSVGVTAMSPDMTEVTNKQLVERADKALYQAKDSGRNKVVAK